jgi:hypothetical protein
MTDPGAILVSRSTTGQETAIMTTPAAGPVQQAAPPQPRVNPAQDSPLDQLMNERQAAKEAIDEATRRFKSADARVKGQTTLAFMAPDGSIPPRIIIGGSAVRDDMVLAWKPERRFDTEKFAADYPDLYEAYRRPGGHWELRKLGG